MAPGFNHFNVLRNFIKLRSEQWMDKDKLDQLKRKKLDEILSCAYNTEYFRNVMDNYSLNPCDIADDLTQLPLTTRDSVRKAPDSFLQKNISKEALHVVTTSGTTGLPLKTYIDSPGFEYRLALEYMMNFEFGLSPFDIMGVVTRHNFPQHPLLQKAGLFKKVYVSPFEDEQKNFQTLLDHKITVFSTVPSIASIYAILNQERGSPLKLKYFASWGEVLIEETRQIISDSFSCPVFDFYGTSEMHAIAYECPEEHNLHLNSSSCLLEIVDDKGRPKKSGIGKVALTTLHNKAMPLLRYTIGDTASWGGECSCGRGSNILKTVGGRSDDVITLPSGRLRSPYSLISRNVINSGLFVAYQLVQEKEDLFVLRYVPLKKTISSSVKEKIKNEIKSGCFGEDVKIEFEEVNCIKKDKSGKMPLVISKVKSKAS